MRRTTLVLLGLVVLGGCREARVPGAGQPHAAVTGTPDVASPGGPPRVTLSAEAVRTAGITTEPGRAERAGSVAGWLTVPGSIEADPARVAMISTRIAGRLERLDVVVGDRVREGDPMAAIWSAPFEAAQTDFILATRRAHAMASTPDSGGTAALASAARRRLTLMGMPDEEVARLEAGAEPSAMLVLRAPFAGSIMEQGAVVGQAVAPGAMIFRLVDLSEVDVVADVPERALAQLRIGQRASVTLAAWPDARYTGVIERIRDEIDPTTRTVDAILHVRNQSGRLRPGMFATVELGVVAGGAALPTGVSIPESAVLTDGSSRIVFVETSERTFERREVAAVPVGSPDAPSQGRRRLLVTRGIDAGERVVVTGAFTLKSELSRSAYAEEE